MSQLRDSEIAVPAEYSLEERNILLQLAHRAISARLKRETLDLTAPSEHLAEKRGAFTSLHSCGRLRGCIGYPLAVASLYRTIADTAAAAGFEDPRFMPVGEDELPHLRVEISVLSPLLPIRAEDVIVGKHGLVVSHAGRRGLLLPQVPLELGWDREMFLTQTCRKALLPPDSWKYGARLEAFTAEVFGEESLRV